MNFVASKQTRRRKISPKDDVDPYVAMYVGFSSLPLTPPKLARKRTVSRVFMVGLSVVLIFRTYSKSYSNGITLYFLQQ